MATIDLLYLALFAVLSLLDNFLGWPAFLRRSQADPGRARRWLWSSWIIQLWTLVAAGVVVWWIEARDLGSLRLVAPHGWQRWVAIGLVLALAWHTGRTVLRIARSKRTKRVQVAGPHVERLAPHTQSELGFWIALSLSAGICEELIYRGYLIFVFQPMLGLWGAATLSVVIFAAAHLYQGPKGALAAGILGVLFTLVTLVLGSLWPAMALHALVDLGAGMVAWLVFRRIRSDGGLEARAGVDKVPSPLHPTSELP